MSFRPPRTDDAARLRAFQLQLTGETPFLLMQPADVSDEAAMAKNLAEGLNNPGRFDLVATVAGTDGERIGADAMAEREVPTRMQHNAYVGIHVLRSHWRRGVGRQLAAAVDTWAREQTCAGSPASSWRTTRARCGLQRRPDSGKSWSRRITPSSTAARRTGCEW